MCVPTQRFAVAIAALLLFASSASAQDLCRLYQPAIPILTAPCCVCANAAMFVAPLEAQPPPGTLGRTYQIQSRQVPEDRHRRTGMLEIRSINPIGDVTSRGLESYLDRNGIWQLETKEPLPPGRPSIFKIEIRHDAGDSRPYAERWVRLRPGRVLTTTF